MTVSYAVRSPAFQDHCRGYVVCRFLENVFSNKLYFGRRQFFGRRIIFRTSRRRDFSSSDVYIRIIYPHYCVTCGLSRGITEASSLFIAPNSHYRHRHHRGYMTFPQEFQVQSHTSAQLPAHLQCKWSNIKPSGNAKIHHNHAITLVL